MARGAARQIGSSLQALRNSAAQFGSQAARTMQAVLSRIAVPFYRQTRGSEAAAGISASIADDKMRGKDVSWTKAILSGGLAALLVFGGSAAQKQANPLATASEAKPAVVQTVGAASGDPYDLLRKHNIPTTLTDEEIQLAKQLDMRMEYEGTGKIPSDFADRAKLEGHFDKHGKEFGGLYKNADEYLEGAKDVIQNGLKVQYKYKLKDGTIETRTGYVRFMSTSRKGEAKFEFVGTNNLGQITTYHVESGKDFWKMLNGNKEKIINPIP